MCELYCYLFLVFVQRPYSSQPALSFFFTAHAQIEYGPGCSGPASKTLTKTKTKGESWNVDLTCVTKLTVTHNFDSEIMMQCRLEYSTTAVCPPTPAGGGGGDPHVRYTLGQFAVAYRSREPHMYSHHLDSLLLIFAVLPLEQGLT